MSAIALIAALLSAAATPGDPPPAQPEKSAGEQPKEAPKVEVAEASLPLPPAPIDGAEQQRFALPGTPASLPAVTAQMYQLKDRFELWPMASVSIGDAFYRMLAVGVRGEMHLSERWSVGGHGLFGTAIASAPVAVCDSGPCGQPGSDQLRSSPGNLDVLLGADVSWVPFYGKLSFAGEKTLHFDTYLGLGPELVRMKIAPDAASPLQSSWQPGGRFSLGQRLFLSDRLAIRVAASELVYGARVRSRPEIERQLSIEGGVSWIFGSR